MKELNSAVTNISVEDTDSEVVSTEEAEDFSSDVYFPKKYHILSEEAISLQKIYVLHLDARFQGVSAKVVVGLSDFSYSLFDLECHLRINSSNLAAHENVITDVRFAQDNENLFYTGSLDGTVKLWDARMEMKPSLTFQDDTDGSNKLKPISCFDLSCDGKFLCAGTVLVEADSYLLFWDVRKSTILGGYWGTHTDDVTQVRFNRSRRSHMLSASTDGLINVYDISKNNEDEALQNSLNVESSIRRIEWTELNGDEIIGCITDMETIQLWKVDDASSYANFSRKALASAMYLKSWDNSYISNMHSVSSNEILFICGSNVNKGEYLKTLTYSEKLQPSASFENNKQIVRCSYYDQSSEIFLTGGECGIIGAWKVAEQYDRKACLKERVKKKRHAV